MSEPLYKSSRHDRPHARVYDHHLNHPAWKALSPPAFKLLVFLLAQYRPEKPNSFPVGARRVSLMISVSEASASKAVQELVEAGHFKLERHGRNYGRVASRERVISLTRYDTELTVGDPDLPIRVWREKDRNTLV